MKPKLYGTLYSVPTGYSINFDTQEKKERKQELKKDKRESTPDKTNKANKTVSADKNSYGEYGWVVLSAEEYGKALTANGTHIYLKRRAGN